MDQVGSILPRKEAYEAIDSECDFVEGCYIPEKRYNKTHSLGEFILMLGQYADQAREKWTHHSDKKDGFPASLHEVRKIAALAVRCMQQHGAPKRA